MTLNPKRKYALIFEFISLAILIASMYWLGQMHKAGGQPLLWQVAIPVVASFGVIAGFLANMYLRWQESAGESNQPSPRNKVFFLLLALSLIGVWTMAVIRTLQSANILG